jgi:acetyl-CoA C-acetyltransferase
LGLDAWDPTRVPTVTGGLTFAGGPWNNYVSHSIASMVDVLRASDPGALGLTTALGWFATKHSMALYSTEPPADGRFRWESPQAAVDALPSRQAVVEHEGPATVEAYTVMHGREGEAETGILALLTADGARTWATTTDRSLMAEMVEGDLVGRGVEVAAGTLKA